MTEETRFNWIAAWVGGLITGVVIFVFLFVIFPFGGPLIVATLLLAALIAVLALFAYRRGQRELAIGMVGGYGLMALVSAGECTLFVGLPGEIAGEGAVRGLVIYPLVLAVALVGVVGSSIYRRRGRGGST